MVDRRGVKIIFGHHISEEDVTDLGGAHLNRVDQDRVGRCTCVDFQLLCSVTQYGQMMHGGHFRFGTMSSR